MLSPDGRLRVSMWPRSHPRTAASLRHVTLLHRAHVSCLAAMELLSPHAELLSSIDWKVDDGGAISGSCQLVSHPHHHSGRRISATRHCEPDDREVAWLR